MRSARYKILDDGTFFGSIPSVPGVWANSTTLEGCRTELQEVLEEWLILSVRTGAHVAGLSTTKSMRNVATYA